MYIPLSGFTTRLASSISMESASFSVADDTRKKLLELLDYYDYTHILIEDGNAREVAKLENYCGTLILYRGKFGSTRLPFPCGAKVSYIITPHTVEKLMCAITTCEDYAMPYTAAVSFSVNLTGKLADIDTDLPIADDKLAELLTAIPAGSFSYMRLCDGFGIEIVKVSNIHGNIRLERGQELTAARTFPSGSVIEHVMTPEAIRNIVCQMECCP